MSSQMKLARSFFVPKTPHPCLIILEIRIRLIVVDARQYSVEGSHGSLRLIADSKDHSGSLLAIVVVCV